MFVLAIGYSLSTQTRAAQVYVLDSCHVNSPSCSAVLRSGWTGDRRLRSAAAHLRCGLHIRIQQRSPPMRRGAKLLRAHTNRAAQIRALEVRALEVGVAHHGSGQHSARPIGILAIGVQKNAAL